MAYSNKLSDLAESLKDYEENDKKLTAFFEEVLPNYDAERVYVSNIKKVIQWFNILVSTGMDFTAVEEKKEEKTEEA